MPGRAGQSSLSLPEPQNICRRVDIWMSHFSPQRRRRHHHRCHGSQPNSRRGKSQISSRRATRVATQRARDFPECSVMQLFLRLFCGPYKHVCTHATTHTHTTQIKYQFRHFNTLYEPLRTRVIIHRSGCDRTNRRPYRGAKWRDLTVIKMEA